MGAIWALCVRMWRSGSCVPHVCFGLALGAVRGAAKGERTMWMAVLDLCRVVIVAATICWSIVAIDAAFTFRFSMQWVYCCTRLARQSSRHESRVHASLPCGFCSVVNQLV
jgi:hypothetical protein